MSMHWEEEWAGVLCGDTESHHQVIKDWKFCCFFTNPVTNLYNLSSLKFFVCSQEKYFHVEALDADCILFWLTWLGLPYHNQKFLKEYKLLHTMVWFTVTAQKVSQWLTARQTDTQTKYSPACSCVHRVKIIHLAVMHVISCKVYS